VAGLKVVLPLGVYAAMLLLTTAGVVPLLVGVVAALGGGIFRDLVIDEVPPLAFADWRYAVTAAGPGGHAAPASHRHAQSPGLSRRLRLARPSGRRRGGRM
jgi:uncharacterized membrane protein YeiH